ncbi:MAG: hypothetical protein GVY16_08090 [Planctomycetes bacterium]|jgi:hypothetical protein|nr:hypothetical protein [Phycisphaerae bacterium]NBB95688.1 hypothetical protein [Planctomycetota bacterium]
MNLRSAILLPVVVLAVVMTAPLNLCAQTDEQADDTVPIRLEGMTEAQADQIANDRPAEPAEAGDAQRRETDIERELTFAEIRRRVLEERAVPVTPSNPDLNLRQGGPAETRRSDERPRFENGEGLVNKLVSVGRGEMGWLAATLLRGKRDDNGDLPSVRLLQCPMLAAMEDVLDERPDALFQISGEVMLFNNEVYLMLRRASIWEGERPAAAGRAACRPVEAGDTGEAPVVAAEPAGFGETAEPTETLSEAMSAEEGDVPSTDDLMDELFRDRPGRALPAPRRQPEDAASEAAESVSPAEPEPLPAGERDLVADRTVRIVRSEDGRWYEVRFVGDNTLREPPMRVLPNKLLSRAIGLMQAPGAAARKFRVTGEVFRYKGRRYVLLRRLLVERDMGQF